MKKWMWILSLVCVLSATRVSAQAVQPSLMVFPSNNWCHQNGFEIEVTKANGKVEKTYDYEKAFVENNKLGQAVHKIGEMMKERGFDLLDLQSQLASQRLENVLDNVGDEDLATSAYDMILQSAGPDIAMHLNWWVEEQGPRKTLYFDLTAFDAYTNKQIASASGSSAPQSGIPDMVMLETAVLKYIDLFNSQLMAHFTDMVEKGREISVRFNCILGWKDGLETEIEGKELTEILESWMHENCVQGRNHQKAATENMMYYDAARIPLFDENGRPYQAKQWLNELRKILRKKGVPCKVKMRGLGQAQLMIGE